MYKKLPINITVEEVTQTLRELSHDIDYVPTDNEIACIISLFLFSIAIDFYICWICKYIWWFSIAGIFWFLYLDPGVDEDD
jgi:hypothetical protein